MASNTTTNQVSERNPEGLPETIVETVDYQSYPGKDPQHEHLRKENIEVIHQLQPDHKAGSASGGGVLSGAAAVVANTIQSAKDAVSGTGTTTTAKPTSQGLRDKLSDPISHH